MGALKKTFLALLILIAVYYLAVIFSVMKNNYSWADMDWNEDGSTSISEFIRSSDVGRREVQVDGNSCIEYFSLKDGLPIKQVCGKKP